MHEGGQSADIIPGYLMGVECLEQKEYSIGCDKNSLLSEEAADIPAVFEKPQSCLRCKRHAQVKLLPLVGDVMED